MRAKTGSFDIEYVDSPESGHRFSPILRLWKLGVLAVFATVITSGLLVNGLQDQVVSAVGADVVSVSSGNWSNGSTWSTGSAPQPGQAVEVAAGHRVVFDVDLTDAGIGRLDIYGTLEFSRDGHAVLESRGNVIVRDGGELIVGTESNPLHPTVNAKIVFDVADNGQFVGGAFFEESDTGLWVFNGGRWESHGAPIELPWTKLAAKATAGSTSVVANGDLSDWYLGGDVLISATGRNISTAQFGSTDYFTEDEERIITGLTPLGDGTTRVDLDAPLSYVHDGSTDPEDPRGEIALLSRNVQVTSKTSERAHTAFMFGSLGAPTFTQFSKLGPKAIFSRYPLHFHLNAETSVGREVRGNVIWDSENRFIVIHNSLGITLESNIGYRGLRSGFWLEETFAGEMGPKPKANTLIKNLAVKVNSVDRFDRRVSAIHAQRENHYIDNVAVSITGSTEASGFGWQEAEIASSGTVFIGNETHSSRAIGLFGWQNHGEYHIVDFTSWRNSTGVKWGAYLNNVQFHDADLFGNVDHNFQARGNKPHIQDSYLGGEPGYPSRDGIFIDKYTLPPSPENPGRVMRSVLENHSGYDVNHISKTSCGLPSQDNVLLCVPTYSAFVDVELRSANNIRFGSDWETTDTFFDVQNYNGTVAGLPQNFRITRPDQPQPSANAVYVEQFDAWADPDNSQPAQWKLPPTIQWDADYSGVDLASGSVTFNATAQGFTSNEGEIEFFIDEFQDGRPWVAEYFGNTNLAGAPVVVLDQEDTSYTWGIEHPPGGTKNLDASALLGLLPDGGWSGRWSRTIRSAGGMYEFEYKANDGLRLFIDGNLITSSWSARSACCTVSGTEQIVLSPGDHNVVVEFLHNSSDPAKFSVDFHRILTGSVDSESFSFDAQDWDRKYMSVYARAHDPNTGFFAYTPILRFTNPTFNEAVPSAPGVALPTPTPVSSVSTPIVEPPPVPTLEPTATPAPSTQSAPQSLPAGDRVINGLLALYEFDEASGTIVEDTSGAGTPLDLAIQRPGNVTWLDGGLRINESTIIESTSSADKVSNAVKATDEITVEAWIRSTKPELGGPARIVTISANPWNRNFTLGQHSKDIDVRLRSSSTNFNGTPSTATNADVVDTELNHVVYTRTASGEAKVYVNGVLVKSQVVSGNLDNWAADYRLALGNEFSGDRPWLGEFYLVALFDRALSPGEIEANFNVGSEITDEVLPEPTATPQPTVTPVPEPTASPVPAPTATPIPAPTATPVPAATATPASVDELHVADLDGSANKFRKFWAARVLVTVTDFEGDPVPDVIVNGSWQGATGETSCTTNSLGVCLVSTDDIRMNTGSATWVTNSLNHSEFEYQPALNGDSDGDSNGTVIAVSKP